MAIAGKRERLFFLIGRDNWQKDDALNHVLLNYLRKTSGKIVWEDPAGGFIFRLRQFENKLKWLPGFVRKLNLRAVQFIYGLLHRDYFHYLSDRRNEDPELRTRKLNESILKLGNQQEIIVISRSAGGRFASRIADETAISRIVCLGYPFRHPDREDEPDRYSHLTGLKTPMLIIQGNHDEYGGLEVPERYLLSDAVELLFVDCTHDFKISSKEWERVLLKIGRFIG